MLKKSNLPLTCKQIGKMMEKGNLMFDNIVQRGLTWEVARKSLLIHSIAMNYPVPALYAVKTKDGYDVLDGKQRCHAIAQFINGEYKLSTLPEVITEDGEVVDISGLYFHELSEELQDVIKDYNITLYHYDNITQDEIVEMFSRLNNGKPLTAIELTRVKAKEKERINSLAQHELFENALSKAQIKGYKNEDIVIKSWIACYNDNKSLETKYVRPFVEKMEITEEQMEEMNQVFERLHEVHDNILLNDETAHAKKIAKKVYTMTHLISLAPTTLQSIKDGMDAETYTAFVKHFFSPEETTTISEKYDSKISAGANKKESVETRLAEIKTAYDNFESELTNPDNQPMDGQTKLGDGGEVIVEENTGEETIA